MGETKRHDPIGMPAKIGAAAVSAIFMAWGLSVVVTQQFDGHTKRGIPIHLDGHAAVLMGMCVMAFGAIPLALLARNGRGAAIWASGWVLVGLGFVVALIV